MSDFTIVLGHGLIQSIIRAFYWTGRLPSAILDPAHQNPAVPLTTLEVYFDEPSVGLDDVGGNITLQFAQYVVARAVNIEHEATGWLRLPIPVTLVTRDAGQGDRQFIRIDPAATPEEAVTLTGDIPNFYNNLILNSVTAALQAMAPIEFRVTPDQFPDLRGELRRYDVPWNWLDELHFFATVDGRPVGAPAVVSGPKTLPAWGDPDAWHNYPVTMGVSGDFILGRLRAALAERGIGPGSILLDNINKKILDLGVGGNVTFQTGIDNPFVPATVTLPLEIDFSPKLRSIKLLSDLNLEFWGEGLLISGRIEADVENWFDPEVDFKVAITLEKGEDGFRPVILFAQADFDADLITALSVALLGPVGLLVAAIIDDILDARISEEVEKQKIPYAVDLPNLIQSAEITGSDDPAAQITLQIAPLVFAFGHGLKVTSRATVQYTPIEVTRPLYIYGNMKSLEVHYSSCPFGKMVALENRQPFFTIEEAVALGYDPCRKCMLTKDGMGSLRVQLIYNRKKTAPYDQPVRITAQRKSGPESDYLTKIELESRAYQPGWNIFLLKPLANGIWTIKVQDGDWQTVIEKPLSNSGKWIQMEVDQD